MMGHRAVTIAVVIAGTGAGLLLLPEAFDPLHPLGDGPIWSRLFMVSIGWSFIFGGIAALWMRRERATGALLILTGVAWWFVLLIGTRVPIIWTISSALEMLFLALLVYLVLAFPEGKLHSWWDRVLVGVQAAVSTSGAVFAMFYDPATFGCPNCPPNLNLLLISDQPDLVVRRADFAGRVEIVLLVMLAVTLWARWTRSTVPRRRILTPLLVPATTFSLSYGAYLIFQQLSRVLIYDAPTQLYRTMITIFTISLLALPIMFIVGLTRLRSRRARIGDLVVELGELPTPDRLQTALRRTLGDPSLEVGIWAPDGKRFFRADGTTLIPPENDPGRIATVLERHGEALAVVVHDPALLDDPGMIDSVTAATRLAIENEKLQQEVLEQLVEVHDSRARIVQAADEERKRIERNLHDGAQQRLVSLSVALQLIDSTLTDAPAKKSLSAVSRELEEALAELRELARGTYPAILSDQGLSAAVESLADRSRLPVEVDIEVDERLPEKVEATAYFVIAEALTNSAKHSQAKSARIRVTKEGDFVVAEVKDDGVGGALAERGSGLRGLVDRVKAMDGELDLASPPGGGTHVVVRIPCG